MPDLLYPVAAGCAGAVHRPGGAPAPCETEPTCTVAHRYRHPRPHTARLLACDRHARGEPDPRALTDGDQADLARRRRVHAEAVALRDANRARASQGES
jgi:hypothetical protein